MDDNARPHRDFFRQEAVTVLPWPSRRLDLNPTEQVWDIMERTKTQEILQYEVMRVPDRNSRWGTAGVPPHNIRPVKGAVHVVVNRQYVEYIVYDPVANDLLMWLKRTKFPDETFFATLNHNPHLKIPGTYQGEPETDPVNKPFLARYKVWQGGKLFGGDCQGKYVRHICIFGVGDLAKFPERKELFANKFHLDFQPAALQCMDEWYLSRTLRERRGESTFDDSYYKTLGFVKNKIPLT
ncbi:N-acetyllactosaminide beta-1,6-N-acetylglucosaminyl-transferase-like [Haliotis rubra]|uniref:N-acetyllactosaminide beta-1,6-N-acetylglucosaminyl-transferase-like n=1 Tax=Haliotis rubra TaxID=36100 RepID=UPI001EE51657|nr:N-acetyllactosaminide beta-1,6-N-acetylglucosaminyl-transferase-like [Haliotis rubra]